MIEYDDLMDLAVEVRDGVGHVRLNRPQVLNAFRTETFGELIDVAERLQLDERVRVVLCTHEGRGFSAGADLSDRRLARPEAPTPIDPMGVSRAGLAMPGIDKPTIAAIDGVCAGAGFALALSFDLRYLGPRARFVTAFGQRGLGPDSGITYHLPRVVGEARAFELLYTSRDVFAEEALTLGLGNELSDVPEDRAWEVARALANDCAPLSLMWMKREMHRTWSSDLRGQIEYEWSAQVELLSTEDAREARRAFVEQRRPEYRGR